MGDRAHIIFTNGLSASSTIYLHWDGHNVPDYIRSLCQMAQDEQEICPGYAAARFIGIAHADIPGVMSLGVFNTAPDVAEAILERNGAHLADLSDGDAGLVIVSTKDYSWEAYGGYLAEEGSVMSEVAS